MRAVLLACCGGIGRKVVPSYYLRVGIEEGKRQEKTRRGEAQAAVSRLVLLGHQFYPSADAISL